MPLTSKTSRADGVYETTCCHRQTRLQRNHRFPLCPECRSRAVWLPIDSSRAEPAFDPSDDRRTEDRRVGDRRQDS